ncbi:hypothetical protein ZTR_02196 [Talaromyces verruculosus]|nr:hypothetical protein ZTR_02196 [Talaromyces verruculosus]
MAQPPARQGLALVILHSELGIAFAQYLLKNTSLPVVFAGGSPKHKNKELVLERLSDIEGAPSRLHYMYGDPTPYSHWPRIAYERLERILAHNGSFRSLRDGQLQAARAAIWELRLGRRASNSQNTASVLPPDHAASAAPLQLTKSFDNFLRRRCKGNAISVAFHPSTKGTSVRNPGFDPEDVLSEDEEVEKIMKVLTTMPADQARERFWDYNGEEVLP